MPRKAKISLHPSYVKGDISPRLFGAFLEPIGNMVIGSMWKPDHPTADDKGFRLFGFSKIYYLFSKGYRFGFFAHIFFLLFVHPPMDPDPEAPIHFFPFLFRHPSEVPSQ